MLTFKGNNVSGRASEGVAVVINRASSDVPGKTSDSEFELLRFFAAKEKALKELSALEKATSLRIGAEEAQIFSIHMMLIEDEDYITAVTAFITEKSLGAEEAVKAAGEHFARLFEALEDDYISRRAEDIRDISQRLAECMADGKRDGLRYAAGVVCAHELSCGDAVMLDRKKVSAVVTAGGSGNSHTAILLKGMGIAYTAGVGEGFLKAVSDGDTVAVDTDGTVYVNPDCTTLSLIREKIQHRDMTCVTASGEALKMSDGREIKVYANISRLSELEEAKECRCGFGLVRSELLFDGADAFWDEEEQTRIYKKIIDAANGERVVIRTFDTGSDKGMGVKDTKGVSHLHKMRLPFENRELLKLQLRAIIRAASKKNVAVMFPMIASGDELSSALECLGEAEKELEERGMVYAKNIERGIMIETPAAAITADKLAPMVDFFSIGTNDLMQYAFACDRTLPAFDSYFATEYETVLRLIAPVAEAAVKCGIGAGICGELATVTSLTASFIKMGITSFSVPLCSMPEIRKAVQGYIATEELS